MPNLQNFEERAIFLAAICGQTYTQFENEDGSFVMPIGFTNIHTIRGKSFGDIWERFGFILESPQEIIIAFRGTSSAPNWVSDIIASQMRFKYLKEHVQTHRGFTNIYTSTRGGILSTLAELGADKALYITGHSLGAALATLCAIDVAANTAFGSPTLFNYGSPRVGNPEFSKAFSKHVPNSYRIANPLDIVTHAPPPIYKLPKREKKYYYSHVKTRSVLTFQNGAIGLNHVISSYFEELTKLKPDFAQRMCTANPGFCPAVKETILT
ncbi:lipase family protein [Paenibacillus puldeungensis]|uniref:Lipase family protein n=1 Tax=Paenibacillus puldeungensis TaxID=696536 RepID=A0ABW3RW03_9BACL